MWSNVKGFRKYSFTVGGLEPATDELFESPQKVMSGSRRLGQWQSACSLGYYLLIKIAAR
jgi:hypothetical protein